MWQPAFWLSGLPCFGSCLKMRSAPFDCHDLGRAPLGLAAEEERTL